MQRTPQLFSARFFRGQVEVKIEVAARIHSWLHTSICPAQADDWPGSANNGCLSASCELEDLIVRSVAVHGLSE
jgi:hypothetical protein